MKWFRPRGQQKTAPEEIPDLYEIAVTSMRYRSNVIPAICPLYLVRAPEIARQIAQVEPKPQGLDATVDYLENEIIRAEFSLMEDTIDGSMDLATYA